MDKWLGRLANVAMIVIAVVATVAVIGRPQRAQGPAEYRPGERVNITKLPINKLTLVVATRSTCRFCSESLDFYKAVAGTGVDVLWVATGEDVETNRNYLTSNGLKVDKIIAFSESGLRINSTPVMVLLDGRGYVVKAWHGKVAKEEESQVIADIKKGA